MIQPLTLADLAKHAPATRPGPEQFAITMSPSPLDHPGIVAALHALGQWGADPYGHRERAERQKGAR